MDLHQGKYRGVVALPFHVDRHGRELIILFCPVILANF